MLDVGIVHTRFGRLEKCQVRWRYQTAQSIMNGAFFIKKVSCSPRPVVIHNIFNYFNLLNELPPESKGVLDPQFHSNNDHSNSNSHHYIQNNDFTF